MEMICEKPVINVMHSGGIPQLQCLGVRLFEPKADTVRGKICQQVVKDKHKF